MRRILWMLALLAVGDGVVTAAMPRRHVRRWSHGPPWYRRTMRPFADHPEATRALGMIEAVVALAWTMRLADHPDRAG